MRQKQDHYFSMAGKLQPVEKTPSLISDNRETGIVGLSSIILVLFLLLFSFPRSAVAAGSYNPITDFSISNGNPNGVWSYGWMPNDFSTFNLYIDSHISLNTSSPQWYRDPDSFGYTPSIWRNDSGSLRYGVAPGQLSLHPSSNFEPSVLRWTAPSEGLYNFAGQFLPGDGNPTIQVGIRQDSNWLWQGVDSGIFNFDRLMITGESIDFLVYGNYWMGNTPLELTITKTNSVDLPRTGQTTCYDSAGAVISCAGTGQDGEILAGVSWPNPRFIDNGDGTMTDNLTGLIWTKDSNAPGPAACSPTTAKTWQDSLNYVDCLNNNAYLGYTDWRLPNINELESLINVGENPAGWLNTQGFNNVLWGSYWSSTTLGNNSNGAWFVVMATGSLYNGRVNWKDKSYSSFVQIDFYAWPVRSGQSNSSANIWKTGQTTSYAAGDDGDIESGVAWPNPRFIDNGDGTVTDNLTRLTWTKYGNTPGPAACSPATTMRWQGALNYVVCLNTNAYLGYTDWHLPNRKELHSLTDFSRFSQALPSGHPFLNIQSTFYWSSTTWASSTNAAWVVDMGSGSVDILVKDYINYNFYVWPVRSGQVGPCVPNTYYQDADNDTYGNASATTQSCTQPAGYVSNISDCNDSNASINPGATEVCNGIDDNCNTQIDEGVQNIYYQDADNDNYGNSSATTQACTAPSGYVSNSSDCNDSNASINPAATEVCNGVDDNCNGQIDEGFPLSTYYQDADSDTYGNASLTTLACIAPSGYVSDNTDCNDANAAINPAATEICNGIDDNCNGQIDDACLIMNDLSISHTDSSDPATPAGQDVTYTITVTNNGPAYATNVTVTDVLDASLILVSATASQGAPCTGTGTITCNLGSMVSGSNATVTVVATTSLTAGMIGSTASVSATEPDPDTANNSASQTTNVGDVSRQVGISTRGKVETGTNIMVGGFSFGGTVSKKVLIRGRGPSMSGPPYNFTGTLTDPILEIYSGQTLIAIVDDWGGPITCLAIGCSPIDELIQRQLDPCQPLIGQTTAPTGCEKEAAILITLSPGAYTAKLKGVNNEVGKGIIEVYDADTTSLTMLGGISTRGKVLTGTDVMVGGFIVGAGTSNKTLLLRGRGPSLSGAPYNFTGTLTNPTLEIYSGPTLFATVDDWQSGAAMCNAPAISCGTPAELETALVDPCQPNAGQTTAPPGCMQESAMFITLPPGAYTAKLKGVNNDTGIGIFEVYELSP